MPAARSNPWPFTRRKAAVKAKPARRSSMTVSHAIAAAFKAGQGNGDTGAFDEWLQKQGLAERSEALKAKLRDAFHQGVEDGEGGEYKGSRIKVHGYRDVRVTGKEATSHKFTSVDSAKHFLDFSATNPNAPNPKVIWVQPSNRFKGRWTFGMVGFPVNTTKSKRGAISGAKRMADAYHGDAEIRISDEIPRIVNPADPYPFKGKLYTDPRKGPIDSGNFHNQEDLNKWVSWTLGSGKPSRKKWFVITTTPSGEQRIATNPTDRALRYRANATPPPGPKVCTFCGSRDTIEIGHVDGHEEHGEPENLIWTCRSCNVIAGNTLKKANLGRRTRQFNPTKRGGAANVGEWMNAVGAIVPHKGAKYSGANYGIASTMGTAEAVAMIRATPAHKRSEYAGKVGKTKSGRARAAAEERWNPQDSADLILQARASRNILELARLHKWAMDNNDSALLAAVEKQAGRLGIDHSDLVKNQPRPWDRKPQFRQRNPRPANVPRNYEVVSIRTTAQDASDVKQALESAGIAAVVTEQQRTSIGTPIGSPYAVWTPKKTYKRAVTLAEQAYFTRHPERLQNPSDAWYVHGIHGATTPTLAGRYNTKAEAQQAARTLASEENETVSVSPPRGKKGFEVEPSGRIKQANPQSEAEALYESFHGRPSTETIEITDQVHEHEHLATLGKLVEIHVETVSGLLAHLQFDPQDPPWLASSEDGRQLYIEGGDQELDLAALKMDGDEWQKDRMVIGTFARPEPRDKGAKRRKHNLTYHTEKRFDQFEPIDYQHDLGEETGVRPLLEYEPRNKLLFISGGQYRIEQPLFSDSPGIEN